MSLDPNCYEVTYRVYGGDNRAGGIVEKTATVKELHEANYYDNGGRSLISVKPKFVHVWDHEVPFGAVKAAVRSHKEMQEKKKQKEKVARLEQELAEAKAKLQ